MDPFVINRGNSEPARERERERKHARVFDAGGRERSERFATVARTDLKLATGGIVGGR